MDDAEWKRFRRRQEREALMATIDDALAQVPGDRAHQLRAEFSDCVEEGGVDSVYSFVECIDWIRIPMLYPLVTEHFVHARVPPKELTQRERDRLARQQHGLAKKLGDASEAARAISSGPSWCGPLAKTLGELAGELTRLAREKQARSPGGPGRLMRAATRLALGLDALFWEPKLPMTQRCRLIAAVVSSFIEPVTGEQIRQRIKDLRRRPRSG